MLLESVVIALLSLTFFLGGVCVCTYVRERKNIKRNDKLQISNLSIADYYPLLFRFVSLSLFIYPYDYP